MKAKDITKLLLLIRRAHELSPAETIAVKYEDNMSVKGFSIYDANGKVKKEISFNSLKQDPNYSVFFKDNDNE